MQEAAGESLTMCSLELFAEHESLQLDSRKY